MRLNFSNSYIIMAPNHGCISTCLMAFIMIYLVLWSLIRTSKIKIQTAIFKTNICFLWTLCRHHASLFELLLLNLWLATYQAFVIGKNLEGKWVGTSPQTSLLLSEESSEPREHTFFFSAKLDRSQGMFLHMMLVSLCLSTDYLPMNSRHDDG